MFRALWRSIALAGLIAFCALAAQAQPYPSQLIRIVLPYSAGTGIDVVARVAADKLRERLGQPVIVENRVGAAGNIGTDYVAKATPNGYTILLVANTIAINPSLYRLNFDTERDLQPIGLFVKGTLVFVVGPSSGAPDLDSFIAAAKAHPGTINYASPGVGTPQHLAMELFRRTAGIDITHVSYRGMREALSDVLGGHVEAMFAPLQTALPQLKSASNPDGRLRPLAVSGPQRHPALPDVPTVAERLKAPDFDVDLWYGFFAPIGTPTAIVDKLNAELRAILKLDAMTDMLRKQGMTAAPSSADELRLLVRSDLQRWHEVITQARIKME